MVRGVFLAVTVFAICTALAVPVLAQAKKDTGQKPALGMEQQKLEFNAWLQRLDRQLNLTPRQEAQIKAILAKSIAEMQALAKNAKLDREARRTQMRTIRDNMNAAIRKHLTADQQQKFDQMRVRWRDRGAGADKPLGPKPKNKPGGPGT